MKFRKTCLLVSLLISSLLFAACSNPNGDDSDGYINPGDYLGGGGTADLETTPKETESDAGLNAKRVVGTLDSASGIPKDATQITNKATISEAGDYYITGEIDGKITITAEGVHLYLNDATLTNAKKVIESAYSLTMTLLGKNSIANSNPDGSTALDCGGKLHLNGSGSLSVNSTKNGISANSITVKDTTLTVNAEKDGLHAEIDYDACTAAPEFSYEAGGFVCIDSASVTIVSKDDGIQADTFVYIAGDATLNVTTNGGAPATVTETSSDNADGKGIKAGTIGWGANDEELENEDYLILVENGNLTINANDDALHSNGIIEINGGTLNIQSGDDGVHAETLLSVASGTVTVSKSYEGLESAKIEIKGGVINVTSFDDGINAADGSSGGMGGRPNSANTNCHILVSGGTVFVNASGDGIDSNGNILISGGMVYVSGSTGNMDAALDADGSIVVNGGYLIAAGALGMVETPASNSAQNVVSFARNTAIAANTTISLVNSNGETIFYFIAPKAFQSVIISCPELVTGNSYKIYGGESELCSFTVNSTITTVGSSGSIHNPGGRPGMGGDFGFHW